MARPKPAVFALLLVAVLAVAPGLAIESREIPLKPGSHARYLENDTAFSWTPFDSLRTHWDLTAYPGGRVTRSWLRPAAEGIPPAPDSMNTEPPAPQVVQTDTFADNSTRDTYLHRTLEGLRANGVDFTRSAYRFIGNYRPNQCVFNTPMARGEEWTNEVQWVYEMWPGVFIVFSEQNSRRVVGRGKVRVPMSGEYYWPCLVVRGYHESRDNMGSAPERRWTYHWVVPGHFLGAAGVASALNADGAGPGFAVVERFLGLEQLTIPGWDLVPPAFADPVVVGDTASTGPFIVSTRILDDRAVGPESLFYRVNLGSWKGVGSDSVRGDTYFYTIPAQATALPRIDYYYWAMDAFSAAEQVRFWTTWPPCSPESTMLTFRVSPVGIEETPGQGRRPTVRVSPNPSTGPVRFSAGLPGTEAAELRIYSSAGRLVRALALYPDSRGRAELDWNGTDFRGRRLASGTYAWRLTAGAETYRGKVVLER